MYIFLCYSMNIAILCMIKHESLDSTHYTCTIILVTSSLSGLLTGLIYTTVLAVFSSRRATTFNADREPESEM